MNTTNGIKTAKDFEGYQEEATLKELVGKNGDIENVIEDSENIISSNFLDFFLNDEAVEQADNECTEKNLINMLDDICSESPPSDVSGTISNPEVIKIDESMLRENVVDKENKDPFGNGLGARWSYNVASFGLYPDQPENSAIRAIRSGEKKRILKAKKPYNIPAPVLVNPDISSQEVTHILDTPVSGVINTKEVMGDIKTWMKKAGINQTKFAEKVLEKTQGHFSVISRNPTPWEELLAPGKSVFVRMYNWMKLSEEEKNKILSAEKVSMKKDLQEKEKKTRFTFPKEQMEVLMGIYEVNDRPGRELIEDLAEKFSLSSNQIKDFFLNRRRRAKKYNL
ncbi:hypothetical protein CRE_16984 [Caenorhabditis remanei]|uniref:One cut domain family member n=1 Tax=Caenorhabditis remanei TaxID=31234 RepID=E3N2E9_CAERE|nr:hypothetical protein CRE_16984 [Caenorhabditis remanei]